MSHIDLNLGVFYPQGGLAGVARAVGKIARESGAAILTNQVVEKIEAAGGRARTVKTQSDSFESDLVIVNADYAFSETRLLDESHRSYSDRYWKRKTWAPSMFLLYLGLDSRMNRMDHHNLYLAPEWSRHFDTIFGRPSWPDKPCFYVSCISKTDPHAAPAGKENVFALVPVAPGLDDSDERREEYAETVIDHIEQITGENIRNSISVKRIYSHRDFRSDYNAYGGTALGLAHTLRQTAIFRPAMKSRRVGNLYYTGQYTHPGVGVPMVLIAARVLKNRIKEDHV
jgi:phytoene desaturase